MSFLQNLIQTTAKTHTGVAATGSDSPCTFLAPHNSSRSPHIATNEHDEYAEDDLESELAQEIASYKHPEKRFNNFGGNWRGPPDDDVVSDEAGEVDEAGEATDDDGASAAVSAPTPKKAVRLGKKARTGARQKAKAESSEKGDEGDAAGASDGAPAAASAPAAALGSAPGKRRQSPAPPADEGGSAKKPRTKSSRRALVERAVDEMLAGTEAQEGGAASSEGKEGKRDEVTGGSARRGSIGGGGARQSGGGSAAQQNALAMLQQEAAQARDEDREMTFEEKASLGAGINKLNSNNLAKVVELIKNSMPSLGAGSDEIEVDINALDNVTLWKLFNFVESCRAFKKKPPPKKKENAQSRTLAIQQEMANAQQEMMQVEAGLHSLDQGPQGIAFSQDDDDDDEVSDSGDEDDAGLPPPVSNAGAGSSAMWADFQNSKKQREREQQLQAERERRQQQEAHLEGERARARAQEQAGARAREIEAQRAAERAQREEEPGLDLLGQSNLMGEFTGGDGGGLEFELDEYGGA